MNLSGATGATITDGQGQGTIIDDDPPPAIGIDDVVMTEGDSGTRSAVFTVSLSALSGQSVSVDFSTADGTATAGVDYAAGAGTVVIPAGTANETVTVVVIGDTDPEPDETFFVNLSNPTNATIADAQGVGTITDDTSILIGLGSGGNGYVEEIDAVGPHGNMSWVDTNWRNYSTAVGETRPALCDVDGDSRYELVLGLGATGSGYLEVKDDSFTGYAHLAWLNVNWTSYNSSNGETYPACGDLDGDGRDEIVVGLGSGGGGWARIFDDYVAGFTPMAGTPVAGGWIQLKWKNYRDTVGEVHPAVGNLDGDPEAEIVLGLANGGGGYMQVFDDANAGFAPMAGTPIAGGWVQLGWGSYNSTYGATWPAVGDLDGDGNGELVIGLGQGGAGYVQVRGDTSTNFAPVAGTPTAGGWLSVPWGNYNNTVGITYPAIGDLDGDGRDELVLGLGTGGGGWVEIREDLPLGLAHSSWGRVHWNSYNNTNGLTRPAVGR